MANKVYIIANGSNDLYYSISQSLNNLVSRLRAQNNYEFNIFYKLCKPLGWDLFMKAGEESYIFQGVGAINYKNGKLKKVDVCGFFKDVIIKGKTIKIMMPDLYLKSMLSNEDNNIVILSGHGGVFQSYLDMSTSPALSLNTVKLLKSIKGLKIDLLYLDMCALNYIEVIYEVLENSNIQNIITYKNIAPFNGISYEELLTKIDEVGSIECGVKKVIQQGNLPLIYFSKEDLTLLEKIKKDLNNIAIRCVKEEAVQFEDDLIQVFSNLRTIGYNYKTVESKHQSNLNFLKFKLKDSQERMLYKNYSFSKNNLWSYFVTGEITESTCTDTRIDIDVIELEKESLKHIVWIHNSKLNEADIEKLVWEYMKLRNEE